MPAPIMGRLAWIDACRGAAATAVLIYHTARHFDKNYGLPLLKGVFQFGHAGVDLFFVISGFVILFIHFDDIGRPERILHYLERRLTRVLPAYWVALALTIMVTWAGHHGARLKDILWAIVPVPTSTDIVVAVAWTLQYEFVFYAIFAMLILSRPAGMMVMLAWLVVIIIGIIWPDAMDGPAAFYGICNLEFFAGMAIAYGLRRGSLRHYRVVLVTGLPLFTFLAIAEDLGLMNGYSDFARFAYGLACTLVVLGAAEASRRGLGRVPAILQTLGSASYSLYLFHFLLIGIAWKLWLAAGLDLVLPPQIGFVLFAAIAIGGGIVISRRVEYPLMRLIRNGVRGPTKHRAFAGSDTPPA